MRLTPAQFAYLGFGKSPSLRREFADSVATLMAVLGGDADSGRSAMSCRASGALRHARCGGKSGAAPSYIMRERNGRLSNSCNTATYFRGSDGRSDTVAAQNPRRVMRTPDTAGV
jgi:hypothetical protein